MTMRKVKKNWSPADIFNLCNNFLFHFANCDCTHNVDNGNRWWIL